MTPMCRVLVVFLVLATATASAQQSDVDFNRDIRPILSDACFTCHGPDAGQRQADLRLDLQEGLFRSLDGTTIIEPGDPDGSELLSRITSHNEDIVMPPPDGGRRVTAAEIERIREWIAAGAKWKGHWAYVPPVRPAVPPATDAASGNEIDRFIQRQLSQKNVTALPAADPVTLARRLAFDLTGLPPSRAQVQQLVANNTAEGRARLVDELLNSDAYAERMTAFWLDQVRYADTNGIHGDNHREVWMYRDWVINAFRSNMPFDQFTTEQLAGDLLPAPTDSQRIASGYNRLLMTTREGGAQAKEYLAKYSADRVRNASTVWLGATMGCCECHDHKFDPYSIKDFYQFAAFFADIQDVAVGTQPSVEMPSSQQKQRRAELNAALASHQKLLNTQTPELDQALETWAKNQQALFAELDAQWQAVRVVDMKSQNGQTLSLGDDGQISTSGPHPKFDTYRIVLAPALERLTAVRLQALTDAAFTRKSLSRPPGNGNFVLSKIRLTLLRSDGTQQPLAVSKAVASFEQKDWQVAKVLNDDQTNGWAVDGHVAAKSPEAIFQLAAAVPLADGDRVMVDLEHNAVEYHNIGRFILSVSAQENADFLKNMVSVPANLHDAVRQWPEVAADLKSKVAAHFRSTTPLLADARTQLAATNKSLEELKKQIPQTLVTRTVKPRTIKVLARGDWMDDSGEVVEPAVPHFLPQVNSADRLSRLQLARWFVDHDNPLVARVFVNRLWKLMFGKGIVKSADDFGSQGSWPTHPELLDWLAVEFRDSGWDVQHVIRLIAASDAYARTSSVTPELLERDPFNDLLARQSRYRLDAEFIRDNALAVSGLLVDKVGGRSVKPYQPAGYWAHLNFPKRAWAPEKGEDQYRRGVYTYWCRTFLHPAMRSFDAPSREECTVDRPRSNNSLQALVLLNDPSFVEAARVLAERTIQEGGDSSPQRLDWLFRTCLSRAPRAAELDVMVHVVAEQKAAFQKSPTDAEALLKIGQRPPTASVDKVELAAWTAVCRVILNLHEVVTRS
ncbi:MAG: PSD1 and planctomycete cytochrome C domain-containing protein [Planctomycetaceae bacterium]|nr:PSD1 and planctomycete cytochrome C domain-containing protein [Planctomycetaceae bacterium]